MSGTAELEVCTCLILDSSKAFKHGIPISTPISNGVKVLGAHLHQLSVIFILTFGIFVVVSPL